MRGATDIAREARTRGATDAADLIWVLMALVDDFLDPNECHYDHHGNCQEHNWFGSGVGSGNVLCPHKRAREILSRRDEVDS